MADFIPDPLRRRLGDERADRLAELLRLIERVLHDVYRMDSRAFDPSIGDNAQLYGLGIWHHGWYALEQTFEDWPEVTVTHEDNSYRIRIWELTLAVYKGGDVAEESIYEVNLNGSTTKKSYAKRNQAQLQLFSPDDLAAPEEERSVDLNGLWVVHFGNPRDQLVKLYVGAPTYDDLDHKQWAWYRRIDTAGDGGGGSRQSFAPTPFDNLPEPEIDLQLEEGEEEAPAAEGE
jgi:hypothetical protein